MKLARLLTLAGAFVLTGFLQSAWAKNYALLIGNSAYSIGALDNPANDAHDLANVLRSTGFDTTVILNQDATAMRQAIRDFGEKLRDNDGIGFFFFAGHGVQVAGENYLLPVGFPLRSENEVQTHAVSANLVLRYMEDAKSRVNVIVLDANTTEQVANGYVEDKMELGAQATSVLGVSQGTSGGLTLDSLVQRLVQSCVAEIDSRYKKR